LPSKQSLSLAFTSLIATVVLPNTGNGWFSQAAHHTLAPSSTCKVTMIWFFAIDSAWMYRMFGLV